MQLSYVQYSIIKPCNDSSLKIIILETHILISITPFNTKIDINDCIRQAVFKSSKQSSVPVYSVILIRPRKSISYVKTWIFARHLLQTHKMKVFCIFTSQNDSAVISFKDKTFSLNNTVIAKF